MSYRLMRFPGGRGKAVTFSYDDGVSYDETLAEILNRYGIKCTFNHNSRWLGSDGRIPVEKVKKLLDEGHEVAVHGAEHLANGIVDPLDGIRDVLECREVLEKTFGRIIRGLAYPDSGINRFTPGVTYEMVRNYLKELGIAYARTAGWENDRFEMPADWYNWIPTTHHNNPELQQYIDKFLSLETDRCNYAEQSPRLFYLWGHSYEFNNQNNWDLIEDVCKKLGGRDDIWYATNIEIYDYTAAYNSLVRSADGKRIYNPTVTPVWFIADWKTYCVGLGETVVIE